MSEAKFVDDVVNIKKVLASWSKEVELFILGHGPFRCSCGCTFQVTAGHADRVRCGSCKELLMVEI